jgi:hypothetical protein
VRLPFRHSGGIDYQLFVVEISVRHGADDISLHGASYQKVSDARKRPIRGLRKRNGRFIWTVDMDFAHGPTPYGIIPLSFKCLGIGISPVA